MQHSSSYLPLGSKETGGRAVERPINTSAAAHNGLSIIVWRCYRSTRLGSEVSRVRSESQPSVCVCFGVCGCIRLFVTPRIVAHQAPLSMRFSRQEYRSGLPFSSSRGSSQPRDRTHISCTGRWILYHWAAWETQFSVLSEDKSRLGINQALKWVIRQG